MKISFIAVLSIALLAACSSGSKESKKLVIMSSGKIQADAQNPQTINLEPGNQHNELELTFKGGAEKTTITVKSGSATATYDLPENGIYLLNLKTDTLSGGIVNFGSGGRPTAITHDQLDHIIDSTQQLIMGQNASDANKTYFIAPNTVKKISANVNAQLIGPYKGTPSSVQADADGKAPEIFKFNTNKQQREELEDLQQRMSK